MSGAGIKDDCTTSIVTIKQLLTTPQLVIPDYQRSYQWTERNVRQLVDDVREFSRYPRYRIGSVILHHNEEGDVDRCDIVDGQQRVITFIILIKALLSMRSGGNDPWTEQMANIGKLEIRRKDSQKLIVANYRAARDAFQFLDGDNDAIDRFLEYFLNKCEVLQITVNELDEAFQMFDSQNARGKALEPTDLLKAFHIRVMERTGVPTEREYDLVNRWEAIPESDIPRLFCDHLYRIRQWSSGRKASDADYAASAVDMFRGVDPDMDQSQNNWAKVYLLALNHVNEYAGANQALTKSGIVNDLSYPFQIDQPVINGEQFFLMTEHYYRLAQWVGIFPAGDETDDVTDELGRYLGNVGTDILDTLHRCSDERNWWRYRHMRNLFDCLMLYYVDRFGMRNLNEAVRSFFVYAATLRLQLQSHRFISTNKYVVDGKVSGLENIPNAFVRIHDSVCTVDAVDVRVPVIELTEKNGERRSNIFRLEDLDDVYDEAVGHVRNEESSASCDSVVRKPFVGVSNEDELRKRVRELVREGFDTVDVILLSMENARIIHHEPRKWKWDHVEWFPYDRRQSIRDWIDDVIKNEKQWGGTT